MFVNLRTPLFIFLSFLVLVPVSDADPRSKSSLSERERELLNSTSRLRGLKVKKQVPVRGMNRDQLKSYLQEQMDEELPDDLARRMQLTLQAFGVFPKGQNLKKTLTKLMVEQIGGFYDPDKDRLYMINDPDRAKKETTALQGLVKQFDLTLRDVYSVHEFTHALQDQHFRLETLPIKQRHRDDRILAIKSLVEGEAMFVMYDFIYQQKNISIMNTRKERMKHLRKSLREASFSGKDDVPLFLRKSLVFPYLGGFRFVLKGRTYGSKENPWKALNGAYRKLPVSTEQILHPEKYFDEPDYPMRPQLPTFSSLRTGQNKPALRNSFGEYGIHLIFLSFFPDRVQEIVRARTGWDGDLYRTYFQTDSDRTSYVWMTTWDSEKDAREFASMYGKLLKKKYGKDRLVKKPRRQVLTLSNTRIAFIHRRGKDVLVGDGLPRSKAFTAARTAWTKTRWSPVKKVQRVSPEKSKKKEK